MQQSKTKAAHRQQSGPKARSVQEPLYEPLDFVMVRAPLLPIEAYLALSDSLRYGTEEGNLRDPIVFEDDSLVPRDPRIRWALAVGSSVLLDDLKRTLPSGKDVDHLKGKLLRFLIRMSTRPTPYGLFAGVALGEWGQETDLALSAERPQTRTRPDMAWLLTIVQALEARLDIRKHLNLVTNSTAFIHAERVFLTERSSIGEASSGPGVSIRASSVVKRALAMARSPILYQDLADHLLAMTPGATPEKVERLLTELWEQTVLLTTLRPPLTIDNPARYVIQCLANIPAADEVRRQLESILQVAEAYDALPPEEGSTAYRLMVAQANEVNKAAGETPVQVDMAMKLRSHHIMQDIGMEAARAAELLLRMTPLPNGLPYLAAYRRAFISRYGVDREIALLELLDPNCGLGSPTTYGAGPNGIDQSKAALRSQTLLNLATSALHNRKQVIELDDETLARLETWTPTALAAPLSLDLNIFVAAASAEALDAGHFQIIVGPNLGAQAAGRNLGRFADLLGHEAQKSLERAARNEEAYTPDKLWAELVYLPRNLRSVNVTIRPAVRSHEISVGTGLVASHSRVIPLDELVVGIRKNRFYVRRPAENRDIVISAGHMLNNMQAPGICRFLAEVSGDGMAQLSSFDWGHVSTFPFLPRVQVGRIVLRQAQWRIDTLTRTLALPPESPEIFREALGGWREEWQVPRHVYLSTGDNRLLLDLEHASQVEELRTEVRHLRDGGSVVLQEVLPGLDQVWLEGPEGHYMTELVASLVLRKRAVQDQRAAEDSSVPLHAGDSARTVRASTVLPADSLKALGSEWLFVKLYCQNTFEDDLIAYSLRTFAEEVLSAGLAKEWFFIRYNDPDAHIRFRLRGEPEQIIGSLLPKLCTWATELMAEEFCSRFVFDTYEREVERYGGMAGIEMAESIFAADSWTVTQLFYLMQERVLQLDRLILAILSVDNLLASLGLSEAGRLQWLRQHVTSRNEVGQEYRQRKVVLRSLLGDVRHLLNEPGGESVLQVFEAQRKRLAPVAASLVEMEGQGKLTQTLDTLYNSFVHMHCNRLFRSDQSFERRVLGLLLRTREGLERSANS
jgi:thiopeptide-type bacteriocin biosynthesis protein